MLEIKTESVLGINQALGKGLIVRASMSAPGGHRNVGITDPREEGESHEQVFGFGSTCPFELSLVCASKSFLEGGKSMHAVYGCCALEVPEQSLFDLFLTAGGGFRAYQKDRKNYLSLKNNYGRSLSVRFETGPDFAETVDFVEKSFHKEQLLRIEQAFASVHESQRKFYQDPSRIIEELRRPAAV